MRISIAGGETVEGQASWLLHKLGTNTVDVQTHGIKTKQ